MQAFETWTLESSPIELPSSVTVQWVYDEYYQTEGSYCLDSSEETAAAEQAEMKALERGDLVPLGCRILFEGEEIDSLWGIVVEPTSQALVEFFKGSMSVPTPTDCALFRLEQAKETIESALRVLTEK